jgi:outer membrane protein OmpA-like peptidoglycan-associated protein
VTLSTISRVGLRSLLLGYSTAALFACSNAAQLHGTLAGLKHVAAEAKRNGAERCAPRELAMAESHLHFAEIELAQGVPSAAEKHLLVAEPNARAALLLSPPDICILKEDRDGDGLEDSVDQCPDVPENYNGVDDNDGCPEDPDTDGDKIPDSADNCVLEPEDFDQYLDEDGCPELDNDADTLVDSKDKCPLEPEDPDGFEDDDGCPDVDNDQDKVLDGEDQCPNEPGPADGERKGCPDKAPLAVVTDCEVKITEQIHFEYNKAVIVPDSFPILNAVVEILQNNQKIKLEIQGHTDNRGTAAYNKKLSDRRAASVLNYLIEHGTDRSRLVSAGYGFERPIVPNDTDSHRALNRRVQFVRTEGEKDGCPKP